MTKKPSATLAWVDPDEAPPWSDEVFDRAEIRHGDTIVREASGTLTKRGRPKLDDPKRAVSIRLSSTVLEHYRGLGAGWQTRLNSDLEQLVAKNRA